MCVFAVNGRAYACPSTGTNSIALYPSQVPITGERIPSKLILYCSLFHEVPT